MKELFTYGLGNVIVSFFSGFPGCIGLSRTVINDEVGVKSQVIYKYKKIYKVFLNCHLNGRCIKTLVKFPTLS